MNALRKWAVPVIRGRVGAGGVDVFGEPIPGDLERVELPPCLFAPRSGALPTVAGVASVGTDPMAYWPGEWPDVRLGDTLEIAGDLWEVAGRPEEWPQGLAVRLAGNESMRGGNADADQG